MVLRGLLVAAAAAVATHGVAVRGDGGTEGGRSHTIRVLVVDADGRPVAGVPVGWGKPGADLGDVRFPDEKQQAMTDERGLAEFALAKFEFRYFPHDVGLAFPNFEKVRVTLAAGEGGGEPLRFVLPPTQRIEVEVVNETGRLVDEPGILQLMLERIGGRSPVHERVTTRITGGLATFPFVGLGGAIGLNGRVGPRWIRAGARSFPQRIETLSTDHRLTRLRVTTEPPGPTLVGRLLRPDRTPAADQLVDFYVRSSSDLDGLAGRSRRLGRPTPISTIRTDSTGCFRATLPTRFDDGWGVLAIPDEFGGTRFAAPIRVAPKPPENDTTGESGEIASGDALLIESTLIAAGTAADERGQPLAETLLNAHVRRSRAPATDPIGDPGEEPIAEPKRDPIEVERERALNEPPQSRATRVDGSFELRAFMSEPCEMVTIQPSKRSFAESNHDEHFPPPSVPFGARDIALVFHRTGTIAAQALLPAGVSATAIAALALPPRGSLAAQPRFAPLLWADDIEIEWLVPGPYDLVIAAAHALPAGAEILRIKDLVVEWGARCVDPRLAAIDLAKRLVVHDLSIVGPDRQPVTSGSLHGRAQNPTVGDVEFLIADGHCRIPIVRGLEGEVVAEIVAPGCAAKIVRVADFAQPIALESAIVVRLAFDPWPLPCRIAAVLEQELPYDPLGSRSVRRQLSITAPFTSERVVDVPLPRPGRWKVSFRGAFEVDGVAESFEIGSPSSPYIEVARSDVPQEFSVRLTDEQVATIRSNVSSRQR